jgi:hypothetical protein
VIHTDLGGAFTPSADPNGASYMQVIIDDYSRYMELNLLREKSEAADLLEFYIKMSKNVTGRYIRVAYHDLGGESSSSKLAEFMKSIGAVFHTSPQGVHQRNPISEANLRRVQDMSRTLMCQGNVPKRCWGFAAKHAANLLNMLVRAESGLSPYELFHGRKPLWHLLKPFGCRAVVHVNKERQDRGKLGVRGLPGRYVGFNPINNTHLVILDGKDGRIGRKAIEAVHVDFDTHGILRWSPRVVNEVDTKSPVNRADMNDVVRADELVEPAFISNQNAKSADELIREDQELKQPGAGLQDGFTVRKEHGQEDMADKGSNIQENEDAKSSMMDERAQSEKTWLSGTGQENEALQSEQNDRSSVTQHNGSSVIVSLKSDEKMDPNEEMPMREMPHSGGDEEMAVEMAVSGGGKHEALTEDDEDKSRRSSRARKPNNFIAMNFYSIDELSDLDNKSNDEPEVRKVFQQPEWKAAIAEEIQSLEKAGTFEKVRLEDLSERERASMVETTIKLKRKRNEEGKIVRYKARLCARGDQYDPANIFGETFAPTPRLSTIRLVLYLVAALTLDTFQLDVKSAFVQARLLESVFLIPCREAVIPSGVIFKCWKSLYGLPQAGVNWYRLLRDTLLAGGLTQSVHDGCLFYLKQAGTIMLVLFHVDDLLLCGPVYLVQKITSYIQSRFPTTGSRQISQYCGMGVKDHGDSISITASAYIETCLQRFNLQSAMPVRTPITERLEPRQEDENKAPVKIYQEMVGSALWIARLCRPDVQFAVHELCAHTTNPSEKHLNAAIRVFQYLLATKEFGLKIPKRSQMELSLFCDADFHRVGNRKPTSGILVMMGGVPLHWLAKSQTLVACSSFEAELSSAFEATREAVSWKMMLEEIRVLHQGPVEIHEDNQAVVFFSSRSDSNEKLKHLPQKYHYIKECVQEGKVRLVSVSTKANLADLLTKPLVANQLESLREALHIQDCSK